MLKKIVVAFALASSLLLLTSCNIEESNMGNNDDTHAYVDSGEILSVEEYLSDLAVEKTVHLKTQADLLLHPLKDAIALFGNDYELSWEGDYVQLKFSDAKCSVEVYVGAEFEHYDWYNNYIDFNDCDIMEYLPFAVIERVVFDGEGMTLTDGISIGMSVDEISEKLNVTGISYSESSTMTTTEYDDNGEKVDVYSIFSSFSDIDCIVVFAGDILSRVEIAYDSKYLVDENAGGDSGKQLINEAFSFVSEKKLATFDEDDLSYKGEIYSPYYDSWFYGWQFIQGAYEGYVINVEQNEPNRIYVASAPESQPILFWCNGEYVDPMLSFLGKWRDYNSNEYIDIKTISKEGIVVFDMYTNVGINTGDMVLLENLNTAINDIPQNLDEYLLAEYADAALEGDVQLFNGEVQSGFYIYGGVKYYLLDSLFMNFNGSVQYLPRSLFDRVGAGPLPIHIPSKNYEYTQASTWGYMENFGRDDPNRDNIVSANAPAGQTVINNYLNNLYNTSGLQYSELEYSYLYDYVFHADNRTYNVWQSNDPENPHYMYVDSANDRIIKEYEINSISRHSKELVYTSNRTVSGNIYTCQVYTTTDGKITVDLEKGTIAKTDAFVKNIEISEIGLDRVGKNERFMFFSDIGDRFVLNGYVLFDHTTWGATLHITDSNIPEFDIGVYYLNSENISLDSALDLEDIPEESTSDITLDDEVEEEGEETRQVIKDLGGRIIGYIYIDANGKKTVKDFHGKILGYYYPDRDVTTDFYGKIIARGDVASALLFDE